MAYFSQGEVLAIVSRLIHESYAHRPDYIDRGALVRAFLADADGQAVAEHGWAQIEADERRSAKGQWHYASKADFVGNMIDWFSAHYGRGNETLTRQFVRVREGKHWAYKPQPGSALPIAASSRAKVSWSEPIMEAAAAPASTPITHPPVQTPETYEPVLTFGLERQLQAALRTNLTQLAPDLVVADGGKERWNSAGRADILARDEEGTLVVIELKAGLADDGALTQLLDYIDAFEQEEGRPVRGVLIAADFSDRTIRVARRMPNVQLQRYAYTFRFQEAR